MLDNVNKQLLDLHLQLSNTLHPTLWAAAEQLSEFRAKTDVTLITMHNLSKHHLDEDAQSVLAKGFNYAVTLTRIPVKDIICGVESSISRIDKNAAEEIRQDVSWVLRTVRPPKKNLTRKEQAVKSLRQNESIILLPADKGNAIIEIDIKDYDAKRNSLLEDPAYQSMTTDPTTYLEKTTKTKVKNNPIDEETQLQVISREK
ncbi:hypothetical protein ILUMI_27414 [Ignelater luminosus]|uniref:Uncharacterized protein n=1 Tax=Ignelater luminosus TaxID=2038154 RepID=A0A8K0C3J1_IGNLU|nr:hypothetical protein ILUMI_27414 [Ignelater luminosus]